MAVTPEPLCGITSYLRCEQTKPGRAGRWPGVFTRSMEAGLLGCPTLGGWAGVSLQGRDPYCSQGSMPSGPAYAAERRSSAPSPLTILGPSGNGGMQFGACNP